MEIINLLHFKDRSELRQWLADNHCKEKCCWVVTYRSKCPEWSAIPYIEVVEEALCFGWIDSTLKRLPDGRMVQRLSPRRPKSHWTQLNLDRCMDLEDRGLMTEAGRIAFEKAFAYEVKSLGRLREAEQLGGLYEIFQLSQFHNPHDFGCKNRTI